MRRNRKVHYDVGHFANCYHWWCPALKKWVNETGKHYTRSCYLAKTMVGALRMCRRLDMLLPADASIYVVQWSYINGKRVAMDYNYRRHKK